jgi:hypothetical protein
MNNCLDHCKIILKKIWSYKLRIYGNIYTVIIHNSNIDSDLILHVEDYDKNSEWVIQKKYNPLF